MTYTAFFFITAQAFFGTWYEQGFSATEIVKRTALERNKVNAYISGYLRGVVKCELTDGMRRLIGKEWKKGLGAATIANNLGLNFEYVYPYICELMGGYEVGANEKITEAQRGKVMNLLRNGCTVAYAAQKIGVSLMAVMKIKGEFDSKKIR